MWRCSKKSIGHLCIGCWRLQATFPSRIWDSTGEPAPPYMVLVAWHGNEIGGMLSGSFDSDLSQSGAFDSFELPPRPHAFLSRVHVHEQVRGMGIGRALVEAYADEALARGCSFIGGSIDLSSDSTDRRAFFERLGFTIREYDNFGAPLPDILTGNTRKRIGR